MIDKDRELIGGISRSNGEFCEEYFINSFKEKPVFMGEKFDRVLPYFRPDPVVIEDEYDLVLRNGKSVVLNYKVYLCLASFRFPDEVRKRADEEGVVLIQQRGEVIEVISENVKYWEL